MTYAGRALAASRRRRVSIATCGAALLSLAVPSLALAQTAPAEYEGFFSADPEAAISLTIEPTNGKRPNVIARAPDLLFHCDDGTVDRRGFIAFRFRLRRDETFGGMAYANSGSYASYFEVQGRLQSGDRAKGWVIAYEESVNPASTGFPDCSTFGKSRWTANRVG